MGIVIGSLTLIPFLLGKVYCYFNHSNFCPPTNTGSTYDGLIFLILPFKGLFFSIYNFELREHLTNLYHLLNEEYFNAPVFFISAIFRKDQPFFKWYGFWFRKHLHDIAHFFVQDEPSAEMLGSIGISGVTISGDTRFDRVADILDSKSENQDIENFCRGHKVLLAGSTWPPDEELLATVRERFPALKMIIAPHEVKEERISQLTEILKIEAARYTKDAAEGWPEKQLLIIDTIGVLSSVYRYADIAYIGGAFGAGLHNIQEAAINGMPVIFGSGYHKFKEAVDLVRLGGAFSVSNENELQECIEKLLNNDNAYSSACEISKRYMLENTGATEKIMKGLGPFLRG